MNFASLKLVIESLGNIDSYMPVQQNRQLVNLNALHSLVQQSRSIPGANSFAVRFEQQAYYKSGANAVPLDTVSNTLLRDAIALRDFLKSVQALVGESAKDEASAEDIYVRFPEITDLPSLTERLSSLETILGQTILGEKIGGKMGVKSVESGSLVIQLYLGSAVAVSFVGSLTWAAAVVFKKYQEALLVKAHVEGLEIRNESLKEIKAGQEKLLKGVVEAEGIHLEKEYFGEENPERLERIKHAIELMQKLLEKGAEVHPALMAPEQAKNLFPGFRKLGLVESRIKQITEKTAS